MARAAVRVNDVTTRKASGRSRGLLAACLCALGGMGQAAPSLTASPGVAGWDASSTLTWARAGTSTPLTRIVVNNLLTTAQPDVAVTFGHAFKLGDIPSGHTVGAELENGTAIPLQVDKKALYADGSLRHAVLSAKLASLPAGGSESLVLFAQAVGAPAPAVALSDLLATSFDAQIRLNVGGTLYTASARDLLQSTTPGAWLSGPQVSEWIVGGPVRTGAGTAHTHLTAYFHVRAYAGNPIDRVRVDVVVENNWSFVAGPGDVTYDATILAGVATVYSKPALTHYHRARWHRRVFWGSEPQAYVQHDFAYLQHTKAVPEYEQVTPTEAFLNSVRQSTEPMSNGDQTPNMDQTGYQAGIGPLPHWDAVYAVGADRRAFRYMLANSDGGAVYGVHYRDEATGYPITIDDYPNTSIAAGGNPALVQAPSTTNPYSAGSGYSHQPSVGYLPYVVTGDYFYLEEAHFWSAYNLIWTHQDYRNHAAGWWYTGSLRGRAWAYRSLAQAAYITPDDHPLKGYFVNKLASNLARDHALYVSPGGPHKNNLGAMYMAEGNDVYRFYDYFMTYVTQYMVDLGFAAAIPLRDYKVKFPIGLMGFSTGEYCFQSASRYTWAVGPTGTSTFYPDFATVYANTDTGAAALTCGSQAMATYLGVSVNEMIGGQDNPTYWFASLQPSLAAAYDSRVPGGRVGWARAQLSGIHPDYRDNPIWAVVPRDASDLIFADGF